ncbi:redoxin domain-containing protein [uncultured Psychroserpens sp.]|uniref:redoxin domain-containing protein n=1 Tax=uncultured Psychroserpens sp. TaxID=255436 RepID=UPI00260D4306|nr:redoxin domain-containing protein [uncultured Psychroserpens sp.]
MKIYKKDVLVILLLSLGLTVIITFVLYQTGIAQKEILIEDSLGRTITKEEFEKMKNNDKIFMSSRKDSINRNIYTIYTEAEIAKNKHLDNRKSYYNDLINKSIPDFKLKNLNDKEFLNNDFKGKITVYTFWFTKCQPCIREIPVLNNLKNEFKNVNFVSMTFENKQILSDFINENDFKFINLYDTMELNKKLQIQSYPLHIVTNKDGIIKFVFSGGINIEEQLTTKINKLLD